MEAKPMEPEVAAVKKKATFVPLDHSSDSSPIVEKTVKDEFMNWKNETIGSKPTDSWKSSNALFKSRSNQSLGKLPLKSFSIDSFSSIDPEFAQLDYLHATGCPAPLPSEVIRVPSFHSQDLDLDEDMESILKQFL
jgi:hypothetical protein